MVRLGPVAAGLIQAAISRSREFAADASGAEVTGDPLALPSALYKIGALMIANPVSGRSMMRVSSTHPDTAERYCGRGAGRALPESRVAAGWRGAAGSALAPESRLATNAISPVQSATMIASPL
jgi:Peptidase family M48